jgi:hypothetical protein
MVFLTQWDILYDIIYSKVGLLKCVGRYFRDIWLLEEVEVL